METNTIRAINVNTNDWECGNYDIVLGKNGKWYQYYSYKNKVTGEEAYQLAEYLFGSAPISKADAESIVGENLISA